MKAKNVAADVVRGVAAKVANLVQAHPGVTDAQLLDLGLNVRKTTRTPLPEPSTQAVIFIAAQSQRMVFVQIAPSAGGRRPRGAAGAAVYSHVGTFPPADFARWTPVCNWTRGVRDLMTVDFPADTPPGQAVWLMARWYGTRGDFGPVGTPVQTNLIGTPGDNRVYRTVDDLEDGHPSKELARRAAFPKAA